MKINSEKKHSVRYDAVGDKAGITSVYVMRTALPVKIPEVLTIKIEIGE